MSELTAHNIRQKADLYWSLWEEFAECLQHVHVMDAMALLELPRGCDYWNDARMLSMIHGTQSHVHDFDGCMYGLKSQFKDAGTAIKKPWRIVSWGVSFKDLHSKCDGSHTHGPCAGRETRLTQLYTDKIVRCLVRQIKNQMVIRLGVAKRYRPIGSVETVNSCICLVHDNDEHEQVLHDHDLFINHILGRGSVKVKFQLYGHRTTPGTDLDPPLVKVKCHLYGHRTTLDTDPDPPLILSSTAMATDPKLMFPSANQVLKKTQRTLQAIQDGGHVDQLPRQFCTYGQTAMRLLQDHDIRAWLDHVQISPAIIMSLAFIMKRSARDRVSHAIHMLMSTFVRVTHPDEEGMLVAEFVDKGFRLGKLFERSAFENKDNNPLRHLCTLDCAQAASDLWSILKTHYSGHSNMITKDITVAELREKISNTTWGSLGSLNQTHPPANGLCHAIRLRTNFHVMNRTTWYECSAEKHFKNTAFGTEMQITEAEMIAMTNNLIEIMKEDVVSMAYALRRYNVRYDEANVGQRIILQDVLEDWTSMKYDLAIERTAAVIHLQTTLMASRLLHGWETKLSETPNFRSQLKEIRQQLKDVKMCLDLRKDIWEIGGYNIAAADSGIYDAVEERNRTFGCIHDFVTTTAASQAAQGSGDLEHIKDWKVPLMPKDGRNPPAQFRPPVWDPHPIVMMTTEAFQKEEERRAPKPQPKARPTGTAGGAASSSAAGSAPPPPPQGQDQGQNQSRPRAKSRPKEPQEPTVLPDWVTRAPPTGYRVQEIKNPDFRNTLFTTTVNVDDLGSYLLSYMQGPAGLGPAVTGWGQYLRRVSAYGCMIFGVCNPRVVTDDSSTKISEVDWLRCYSHLVRTFMIARNGCYPSTASMLMLLGRNNPQTAHLSGLAEVKKGITNALACEIEENPQNPRDSDSLAGKMRSGTTILVTDLLYRLKTSSGMTHDAGAGIADMGWEIAFFKIFESKEQRPIDKFVDTLRKVGKYLDTDVNDDGNVTVHVWLSMQFLHAETPPYQVLLEKDFNKMFVKAIVELDGKTTRPILVTLSADSNFNEIDSITSSIAMELTDMLRSKGIMVTTDQRIWRSMYSVYGRQFRIFSTQRSAHNYGKTAIWAVMEKHLFRQRVFLMCATNRERVSTLNEGAYKLECSGIEPTVLKKLREQRRHLQLQVERWSKKTTPKSTVPSSKANSKVHQQRALTRTRDSKRNGWIRRSCYWFPVKGRHP